MGELAAVVIDWMRERQVCPETLVQGDRESEPSLEIRTAVMKRT